MPPTENILLQMHRDRRDTQDVMLCEIGESSCSRLPLGEESLRLCESTRELRRRMEVSQREFARLVGTTKRTIARWEARQNAPSRLKRFRLGRLLEFVNNLDMRDRTAPVRFIDG